MSGRTRLYAGLTVLVFIHASFALMLLSPWLENPWGRRLDERALREAGLRIEQIRKGNFTVTFRDASGAPLAGATVTYNQVRHDFRFGCNLFQFGELEGEADRRYQDYFTRVFNLAVIPFYWSKFEPEPGVFPTTDQISAMLEWCGQNQILAKGHPLAWRNPAGYPAWLPEDKLKVRELLEERIGRIVRDYAGRISVWDVVNEPTHLPAMGGRSREEYVEQALKRARAADPDAALTVNDYGIMGHDFGGGPFYRLIRELLRRGAPLNRVGLQGREPRTDWVPAYEIKATLDAYAGFGLPVDVTELTFPSSALPITNSWRKGPWDEAAQADYLEAYYKMCFSHPAVESVIYWDLWDGASWIKTGGLIREDWTEKPSYQRLDRLINHEWHTSGEAVTDGAGQVKLRGFYGTYELRLPGRERPMFVMVRKGGPANLIVTIPE